MLWVRLAGQEHVLEALHVERRSAAACCWGRRSFRSSPVLAARALRLHACKCLCEGVRGHHRRAQRREAGPRRRVGAGHAVPCRHIIATTTARLASVSSGRAVRVASRTIHVVRSCILGGLWGKRRLGRVVWAGQVRLRLRLRRDGDGGALYANVLLCPDRHCVTITLLLPGQSGTAVGIPSAAAAAAPSGLWSASALVKEARGTAASGDEAARWRARDARKGFPDDMAAS